MATLYFFSSKVSQKCSTDSVLLRVDDKIRYIVTSGYTCTSKEVQFDSAQRKSTRLPSLTNLVHYVNTSSVYPPVVTYTSI